MLGYGIETKAYRLYDTERERVIRSHDMVFNEMKNGIEMETVDENSGRESVRLECSNEDNHTESPQEEEK